MQILKNGVNWKTERQKLLNDVAIFFPRALKLT